MVVFSGNVPQNKFYYKLNVHGTTCLYCRICTHENGLVVRYKYSCNFVFSVERVLVFSFVSSQLL